jgi:hypothetical protein
MGEDYVMKSVIYIQYISTSHIVHYEHMLPWFAAIIAIRGLGN